MSKKVDKSGQNNGRYSHGLINHPLYNSWKVAKRSKMICEEWKDFKVFYDWAIQFWKEKLVLTRKNKSELYCPNNCCFTEKGNISKNNINHKKRKETCIKKYGAEHPLQNQEVLDKVKQTCLEKYGYETPLKNEDVKNKIKATNINRYGYENILSSPVIKEKIKNTNIKKYGCEYPAQNTNIKLKQQNILYDKYGCLFNRKSAHLTQNEIRDFLKELGCDFNSDRSILNGKEIDLYNKELNLAIEYCGLYWHTEDSPEPRNYKYHYNKYKACLNKNIQLLTIFSDEWKFRNKQVKQFIRAKVGKCENKVYARNCIVKKIHNNEAKNFINENHIQLCKIAPQISYGIFCNDELLGVVSFKKHHRNSNDIILNRLAFKNNYQIIGGASKLIKNAIKISNFDKVITWSDNRYTNGNLYENIGFKLDGLLKPDYSYVLIKKPTIRYNKQSMKKKDIQCPSGMTEKEYLNSIGYSRIWDCGKKRWVYNQEYSNSI